MIFKALFFTAIFALCSCVTKRENNNAELKLFGLNFFGVPRKVIVAQDRPANAYFKRKTDGKRPLILFLHGFGNEPEPLSLIFGMPRNFDKNNFVLLVPRGTLGPVPGTEEKKLYWNATKDCCGLEKPDDDAYLTELVQKAVADPELQIDSNQIYIFGYSNGAFMAHTLACNHANIFRGIIAYGGTSHEDAELCKPTQGVNILHIHGTNDQIIRFDNPSRRPTEQNNFWFPPPGEIVKRWAALNGCSSKTTTERIGIVDLNIQPNPNMEKAAGIIVTGKGIFNTDKETEVETYTQCSKAQLAFWKIEGGTHFNIFNPTTFDRAWSFIQTPFPPKNSQQKR